MAFLCALLFVATLPGQDVRFTGKTKYLHNARAVVVHSIDDSTKYVPETIDAMDRHGIKATLFISTEEDPAPEDRFFTQLQVRDLWPRLRKAVADGHEIGSHSRQHSCKKPDDEAFCAAAYSEYEIAGSRDDILRLTQQPYVWSWCYPCGNCATYPFIQKRIAAAGYIVARNYPNELQNGHVRPDVQDFDENPMNAGYTQVVQHRNSARSDTVDLAALNAKFDEVYAKGGIYHFLSHPQWLDFGPQGFYESHLRHAGGRPDAWYVPMGPLYAFRALRDRTEIKQESRNTFSVRHDLDRRIYSGTVTLRFEAPEGTAVRAGDNWVAELGQAPQGRWDMEYVRREGGSLYVTVRPDTTLHFFQPAAPGQIAGNWKVSYRTRNGLERQSTLQLETDGGKVSGMLQGERGNAPITEGVFAGNRLRLTILRKGNNDEVPVSCEGVWDGGVLYLRLAFRGAEAIAAVGRRQ
jgi:peptidoglycan/xylan/chitin deacetylase (PgdA/CDA1 family)